MKRRRNNEDGRRGRKKTCIFAGRCTQVANAPAVQASRISKELTLGDDDELWCQHRIVWSVNMVQRPMRPLLYPTSIELVKTNK